LMQKIPFIFTNDTADILRKMMLEIIDVLIEKKEFPQYNNEELSPKLRAFIELERTERGKRKLVFVNQLADNALRILEKYKLDL